MKYEHPKNSGKQFLNSKVLFAENSLPYFNESNMKKSFDLEERVVDVCERIKLWNSL